MRLSFILASCAIALCGQASAEAESSKATTQIGLDLDPAIGKTIRSTDGNEAVDDSEAALSVKFTQSLTDKLKFEITPAAAYSPQYYDHGDRTSQLRLNITISRSFSASHEARIQRFTSSGKLDGKVFASYAPSLGFKDFLGKQTYFDNALSGGVRLGNEVWFHCRQRWIITVGLGCGENRKIGFEIVPRVQYSFSDQSSRRRLTPRLDATATVPVGNLDLKLGARFENRRFTETRIANGGLQRDGRVTVDLSFDFANAIKKMLQQDAQQSLYGFSLELGASYVRNRSNNPTSNFDRIFFVPSIAITRQLS